LPFKTENPKLKQTIAETKFLIERAEAEATGETLDLEMVRIVFGSAIYSSLLFYCTLPPPPPTRHSSRKSLNS
jgi:hypothetical protein